ncbi:chitinase-3-like protein 1 isoform X2 [Haliotis rubra]|nr:chitinase-3-like protein 1 isoform X2 [Haliotis rubra]XP_046560958.1 chitinase-3-like protein 1 isoform X2 [Haliotis rubra]XP_046560968.1 chitinase-3-like protein 1 isoform X2 [Haliotis rubra]XP_046560976.1 chitinase-3-like protein 1 isoform X2 [Haliotis rubra]
MARIFLLTVLMVLSMQEKSNVAGYITACYFTSWSALTSPTQVRLPVEDVDASLCTHLMYAFASLDIQSMSVVALDPFHEYSRAGMTGLYEQFNQLKSKNPNLKTLLSVGGQSSGRAFSQLSSSKLSLQQFAQNTMKFLRKHGFDGLDIDWEYPAAETKDKFTFLLKILSEEFSNEATNKEPLLLTIAGAGGEDKIRAGYDIKAISKYLDYIFVMTYDFSGSWNKVTGFDSPLRARNDSNFSPVYNVQYALNVWINGGADRSKVIMGLTGAGASFTLRNITDHNVGAPVQDGGGPPGPLYQQKGRLMYPEICQSLKKGWTRVWDEEQQVPYAYRGDQWVGYDDQQSFGLKVQYVIDEHLGGVMFWELSFDDAKNYCKNGAFPLLHVVKQTFANHPMDSNKTSETGSTDAVSQSSDATEENPTTPSHRTITTDSNNGTVHFVTSLTKDTGVKLKSTVVFDQVDENIGEAYSPTTGEFTAPVSGFYLFTIQVMATYGSGLEYELKSEDSAYSTRVRVESAWSTSSGTAVFHVQKGHKVKVIKYYGPDGALRQSPWSRFSGFLLRES